MSEGQEKTEEQKENSSSESSELSSAALEKSLQECQEKYLRLLAESENVRKRMQKERQELTKYAVENIIVEFLHPLDSFEKALKFAESASEEVKNWAVGFEMILGQFKQVLSNHNVLPFDSVGKPFDPHVHEAVEVVETNEHSPGTIVQEFLRGYRMGDRIVRHSRVKVAKALVPSQDNSEGLK